MLAPPLTPHIQLDRLDDDADMTPRGKLPLKLVGDHERFQQALVNLLKHAFKYCGGRTLHILAAYDADAGSLAVQVADAGREVDMHTE